MEKYRVLIVDDDKEIAEAISIYLTQENIITELAYDGEEAIQKMREEDYQLIIMDIMMPKLDGITLSHKLKSNRKTKHIPIIISTAKNLSEEELISLHEIVEDITVKSKGHPLDVLKTVRDRIKMQEVDEFFTNDDSEPSSNSNLLVEEESIGDFFGEVLIVDDDPDMVDFIKVSLHSAFEVVSASDGLEAIRKLVVYQPDIFLLDIMLPKMSGYQLCQSLRRNATFSNAPILIVSAKSTQKDIDYAKRMGADSYLTKPFTPKELLDMINDLIKRRQVVVRSKTHSIKDINEHEIEKK